jgi:hypothetical protein
MRPCFEGKNELCPQDVPEAGVGGICKALQGNYAKYPVGWKSVWDRMVGKGQLIQQQLLQKKFDTIFKKIL